MKPVSASAEVREQVKELSAGPSRSVSRDDIRLVVQDVLASMSGGVAAPDLKLYGELAALAQFIEHAKAEIAAVRPQEISDEHIPLATDELDAVVGATEDATGAILDACETIETVSTQLPPEIAEKLSDAVTRIYEACNFQDVTGQRITKVVKTLQHIESRVDAILGAFGDEGRGGELRPHMAAPSTTARVDETVLLNGPQLPDEAMKQAEIDAILASFD